MLICYLSYIFICLFQIMYKSLVYWFDEDLRCSFNQGYSCACLVHQAMCLVLWSGRTLCLYESLFDIKVHLHCHLPETDSVFSYRAEKTEILNEDLQDVNISSYIFKDSSHSTFVSCPTRKCINSSTSTLRGLDIIRSSV
jgi:hypothetical protein